MIFPKKAKDLITAPIPTNLIKQREGAKKIMLSYITGSTVIDILNNAFNYLWDLEIVKVWKEDSVDKFNPKYDKKPTPQNPVAHAIVKLIVYLPQENGTICTITKSGTGSKSVIGGQSEQESIYKAAVTDAIKKAASLFGIGLELYRGEEEQDFFDEINYEDPWTDENKKKYAEQLEYVSSILNEYDLSEDDQSDIMKEFSEQELDSFEQLVPENIVDFCSYLKNKIEQESAESK